MRRLRKFGIFHPVNGAAFVSFIMLYAVFYGVIFSPLLKRFSYLVMQAVGFRYLTAENIYQLFKNPIVYAALAVAGLAYASLELFEISGILYLYDAENKQLQVTLGEIFRFSAFTVRDTFQKHYRGMILLTLIISPMYHLGTAVNLLNSYSLFAMLVRSLQRHVYSRIVLAVGIVIYILLFLHFLFVPHLYIVENENCRRARQCSGESVRRLGLKQSAGVFIHQLLLTLIFMLLNIGVIALIGLVKKVGLAPGSAVSSVQVTVMKTMETMFDTCMVPIFLYYISKRYYRVRETESRPIVPSYRFAMAKREKRAPHKGKLRHKHAMLAASVLIFTFFTAITARSQFTLRIEHLRSVEVSAHRGASMFYPENTMAAFAGAVEQGTDWIELDVQETKDGKLIIMHDANLKRTTGVDAKIWETDYAEIKDLDAGSFFNSEYAGEHIPLLEEVIEFAQENQIRLNIELKPTGHETNLVDGVLDLVEENGFEEQCVITSQKYDILRQVKNRNENIQTVYVMGLAYGAINRLKAADAFSIRSTSITQSLVTDLHNRGLEVYAWTVDSRANMNRMINLGVDNIITNNVPLAIECINKSQTESILWQIFQMLAERFK